MFAGTEQPEALTARVAELEAEIAGLRRALQTRTVIGQATGLLAAIQEISPQEGFKLLVALSQQHNLKLHTIADQLVALAAEVGPRAAVGVVGVLNVPATKVAVAARVLVRIRDELSAVRPGSDTWWERQAALLDACDRLCDEFVAADWVSVETAVANAEDNITEDIPWGGQSSSG